MIHDQVEELLGAYALHATTKEEAAQVDAHLTTCPRCRAEVAAYEEVAAMLGSTSGEAPSGLWEKISASIAQPPTDARPPGFRLAPVLGPGARDATAGAPAGEGPGRVTDLSARRNRRQRFAVAVLGAAAAAVIGVLGAQVAHLQDQVRTLDNAVGAQKVLDSPHLTVQLRSPAHAPAATVVVSPSGTAYWLASELPSLPPQKTYQLWGLVRGKPVSLGLLGPRPGVVSSFRVEASVTELMVTAEPQGGTPTPTTAVLAQGALRQA